MPYICLNLIYCFPKTWDEGSGRNRQTDYRQTKSYQYMLRACTGCPETSDIPMYPHRQFFGIADDQFNFNSADIRHESHWLKECAGGVNGYGRTNKYPYGKLTIEEILDLEKPNRHRPSTLDVRLVRSMLCRKGLPVELAWDIMEFAQYEPSRRLNVPHDPFHSANREELGRYLTYCWQILVRCDVIAKAVGVKISWQKRIALCIVQIWDSKEILDSFRSQGWICGCGRHFGVRE